MNGHHYLIGFDLGGTRLKAVAVTPDGTELARETHPSDDDWMDRVRACHRDLTSRFGPPLAVGAAAPGLASADERRISFMPGRLTGLEGLDWTRFLSSPTAIPVLNDAHAALLGEAWLGAAKGERDVILITLGTGVGGAILSDGKLLRGHLGRAGHLGHITVDAGGPPDLVNIPGSLEDAVGNHSLHHRSNGRYTTTRELAGDVARGDPGAAAIWDRMIRDLAAAIASLVNITDPALVLLGGGIAEAGDILFTPLQSALDRFEWRPGGSQIRLARAQLGEWAGAYGAAAYALQSIRPSSP